MLTDADVFGRVLAAYQDRENRPPEPVLGPPRKEMLAALSALSRFSVTNRVDPRRPDSTPGTPSASQKKRAGCFWQPVESPLWVTAAHDLHR